MMALIYLTIATLNVIAMAHGISIEHYGSASFNGFGVKIK